MGPPSEVEEEKVVSRAESGTTPCLYTVENQHTVTYLKFLGCRELRYRRGIEECSWKCIYIVRVVSTSVFI